MHISDGILTDTLAGQIGLASTSLASVGLLAYSIRKIKTEDISRTALLSAVFFVSSLIHFKFAFTSLHLVMIGLMGILLGWRSIAAIFVGLTLQALFFGHGGLTVLGVNLFNFSTGALTAMFLYRLFGGRQSKGIVAGFIAGFAAVCVAAAFLAVEVFLVGEELSIIAELVLLANLPLAVIEGILAAFVLKFIQRVRPAMLYQS